MAKNRSEFQNFIELNKLLRKYLKIDFQYMLIEIQN